MRPARRPSDRPARLAVGVVGTGRVGSVLGAALVRAGHQVVAVSAVSHASVRRAQRQLPDAPITSIEQVVADAELVLLAVPDDALEAVVTGLAETERWRRGQLVVHTSGAYGVGVLAPATRAGALPLALHPAMTFTGRSEDDARLAGAPFGVTAPDPLRPVAESLVVEMGGEPIWVDEQARPLYHAALTVGSNHLVTLVTESADLLRRAGVAEPSRMLGPLLHASLDNALRQGDSGLTGPVSRGDARTVAAHLSTLAEHAPQSVAAYVAMARLTADRALAAGRLAPERAESLLGVLADPQRGGAT